MAGHNQTGTAAGRKKSETKEAVYRKQMQELGIYDPIFEPEIKTLARIERELTRAEKAWSRTAPPGGKPSFLNDHYPIIQKLRSELLQHRDALGLTPKALRKLVGAAGSDAPQQADLIASKLDQIALRVAGYDVDAAEINPDWWKHNEAGAPVMAFDADAKLPPGGDLTLAGPGPRIGADPFAGIPEASEAARISHEMDEELRKAGAADME